MPRRKLPSGELESRVLDVLWTADRAMTPGEVHAILATDRDLAYTTVMTILSRLCDKGELLRTKRGRAYAYRPLVGREQRVAQRMHDVLEAAQDHAVALNAFAATLSAAEQAALRAALKKRGANR